MVDSLIHVVLSATAKNNSTCKSFLEALQIPGYLWGLQILHIPAKAKSIPPLGRRAMVSYLTSLYISIYLLHFCTLFFGLSICVAISHSKILIHFHDIMT